MSLLDLLLSSTLFLGTAAASLSVWSGAARLLATDQERQRGHDQLEAELLAGELRMRAPELLGSPRVSCDLQAGRLAAALLAKPAAPGIERQLESLQARLPGGAEPLPLLRLRLRQGAMVRERTYQPAALGGCGLAEAARAEVGPEPANASGSEAHGSL